MIGCAGSVEDVRTDRNIVVYQDEGGPRLVLVSEAALKADGSDKYQEIWSRSEFTSTEVSSAYYRYLSGGICPISGALIAPVSPEEATKLRDELAESVTDDVSKEMTGATAEVIHAEALARADAFAPELANLVALVPQ